MIKREKQPFFFFNATKNMTNGLAFSVVLFFFPH